MITLTNGHRFEFQCGSGALGFDGRGWWWEHPLRWLGIIDPTQFTVVSKTVTTEPRRGELSMWHPWTCVRLLKHGTVNAVSLTNPGILEWKNSHYPVARSGGYKIAASVDAQSWAEAFTQGTILKDLQLAFIELNASCPNVSAQVERDVICRLVKGLAAGGPSHPIIVKLSFAQCNNQVLLSSLNALPQVEAIHAINAVPWEDIFPGQESPIEKHVGKKGGVSGRYIHEHARRAVRAVRQFAPDKPVVAGGGIESVRELENFQEDGATAFSIGTLFLRRPWRPNEIIKEWTG